MVGRLKTLRTYVTVIILTKLKFVSNLKIIKRQIKQAQKLQVVITLKQISGVR